MPVTKSAWKRMRQSKKRHARNIATLSELKTLSKKFFVYLKEDPSKAKEQAHLLSSRLDKAASKGIIPKGRANRKKARIASGLEKIGKKK